ncbi:hypothetical protein SpCBS45565_g04061 [Spizellomyces sp. 'palustris']|nr:hypothetical protein SpCBS45565_g04061 [Spizellomyces sp. 'palustris']
MSRRHVPAGSGQSDRGDDQTTIEDAQHDLTPTRSLSSIYDRYYTQAVYKPIATENNVDKHHVGYYEAAYPDSSESSLSTPFLSPPRRKDTSDAYDPDAMLCSVADEAWSDRTLKISWFQRVRSWYKPVYDYKTPGLSYKERRRPRYCGGRLKRWQFILLHALIIGLFMAIVVAPLTYFVIIPAIIQSKINGIDMESLGISRIDVVSWSANGLRFGFAATLPSQLFLPIRVTLAPMSAVVGEKKNFKDGWAEAKLPEFSIKINEEIKLDFEGDLLIRDSEALAGLIEAFSNDKLQGMGIRAKFGATIKIWGITWYKNLPLHKDLNLPDVGPTVAGLYKALPQAVRARNLNQAIRSRFAAKDLWTFQDPTLPDMAIQSVNISMSDTGLGLNVGVVFENPTIVQVGVPPLSVGLSVLDRTIAVVTVQGVNLYRGVTEMKLEADVRFVEAEAETTGKVIGALVGWLLGAEDTEGMRPSVKGPVAMEGVQFVGDVTKPLSLLLPVNATLEALNFGNLKGLLSVSGIERLLSSSKFSASVGSTDITAPISLSLPRLIPLPPIDFTYITSLNVHRALDVTVNPIRIVTGPEDMKIGTTVVVVPVNTDAAAAGLAAAINPILQAKPQTSSISILGLTFSAPLAAANNTSNNTTSRTGFKWSDTLLKPTTIPVPLPVLCIPCIVTQLTRNGTQLPLSIHALDVNQLLDAPGFGAKGQVGIAYPTALAKLEMNVGYVGAGIQMGSAAVPVLGVDLPTGLRFSPISGNGETAVDLDARLVIGRNDRIVGVVQSFVDAFMADTPAGDGATIVTITDIFFGAAPTNRFVTFSKIALSIDAQQFKEIASTIVNSALGQVLKKDLVVLNDLGLNVISAGQVDIGIKALVRNPVMIGLNIGSIVVDAALDDGHLSGVQVSPIVLGKGTSPIDLAASATPATGGNGMANKVAVLVNDLIAEKVSSVVLGISGFKMVPPGMVVGNGTGGAIIDQFSSLKFRIPPTLLHRLNPLRSDASINLSEILGVDPQLNGFGLALSSASVRTLPQASLAVGAGAQLTNPMPVSAKVPYAEITMEFGGLDFVVVSVSNISVVAKGTGSMNPSLSMRFVHSEGIQDKVAEFVSTFINGRIMDGVGIKTIYFGTGPNERNDLLSAVKLDVSSFTKNIRTESIVEGLVGMVLGKDIHFPLSVNDLFGAVKQIVEGTVRVEIQANKIIAANLDGMRMAFPFTIEADIGLVGVGIGIDGSGLMDVNIPAGIKIVTSKINGLGAVVRFADGEETQNSVADLGRWMFDGNEKGVSIVAAGLRLGVSDSDRISSFDKVTISIPVQSIIRPEGDLTPLLNLFAPSITRVDLATMPGNAMSLAAGVALQSPIQLAAKLGWVGADVNLDSHPVVDVGLPNLAIDASNGSSTLAVATSLLFKDTDGTRRAVAKLVNGIVNGGVESVIGIEGLVLGASQADSIKSFQKLSIPFRVASLLNEFGMTVPVDYAQVQRFLTMGLLSMAIDISSGKKMDVGVGANISIVPFPTTIKIGSVGVEVDVNGAGFMGVGLPEGIHIGRGNTDIKAAVTFKESDRTEREVARLVDGFLNGPKVGSTIGMGQLVIGNSLAKEDRITILDQVHLPLDVDKVCQGLGIAVPMDITQLLGSTSPSLGTLHVKTEPRQTLSITASTNFTLPFSFPVDLKVGYVSAGANVGEKRDQMHPLADFSIPNGMVIKGNGFGADLKASLKFKDQEATREVIAGMVQGLFDKGMDGWVGVEGIKVGGRENDVIRAFSKVRVNLSLGRLLSQLNITTPLNLPSLASQLNATLSDLTVATAPASSLDVSTKLGFTLPLPFSITFQAEYFYARATVGNAPLAVLQMPGLSLGAADHGRSTLDVATRLKFLETEQGMTEVARIVDNVLQRDKADSSVGVDGVMFGSSDDPDNWIRFLSKAKIGLPADSLLQSFGVTLPLSLTSLPSSLNVTIDNPVQLKTLPKRQMAVNTVASFAMPFAIDLSIGFVSIRANVNGKGLVNVALPGLTVKRDEGRSRIAVDTVVTFEDGSDVQAELAKVVGEIFEAKLTSRVGVDHVVFGVSEQDTIKSFSKANLALPVSAFVNATEPINLGAVTASYLESILLSNNASESTGLTIKHASLSALPSDKLNAKAQAHIPLPLPFKVELDIGYAGVRWIGVDKIKVLGVDVRGIQLKDEDVEIDALMGFEDSGDSRSVLKHVTDGNGDGSFAGTLGIAGLVFGATDGDFIQAFTKIELPIPINPVGQVLSKYVNHLIDNLLSGVPSTGAIQHAPSTGFQIHFSKNASLTISHAGVEFQPASTITADVTGSLQFPVDIAANLPFLAVAIGLDDVSFLDTSVNGVKINGQGENGLQLGAKLKVFDSDPVQDKIAAIAKAFFDNQSNLPGRLRITGVKLGVASTDSIETFSEMVFSLSLDRVLGPFIKSSQNQTLDIGEYVNGIKLNRLGVRAAEGRALVVDAGVGFNSLFPITIKGLGYVAVDLGVDEVDLMTVGLPGIMLVDGANSMDLRVNVGFRSSDSVQTKVASLFQNIYTVGWGNTKELLALAGLKIGYSESDYIRAFSKARLGLPSATVLSPGHVDWVLSLVGMNRSDFTAANLLPRIDIQGAHISFDDQDRLQVVGKALLKGFSVDASIAFPHVSTQLGLSGQVLADVEMKNLVIRQQGGNGLLTEFSMTMAFPNGGTGGIQQAVADIASDMQKPNGTIRGVGQATKFGFGISKDDMIDALGKCVGELSMQSIGRPAASLFHDLLVSVVLDLVDLAPVSESALEANVIAHMTPIIRDIMASIPFLYIDVRVDNNVFVMAEATDIRLDPSGKVLVKANAGFALQNRAAAQTLATIGGDVIFRRLKPITTKVAFGGIRFGRSKETAIRIAETAIIDFDVATFLKGVADYVSSPASEMVLTDIITQVTPEGADVKATGKPLGPLMPFRARPGASAIAVVTYDKTDIVQVYFNKIAIEPGKPIELNIKVLFLLPDIVGSLQDIIPRLLTWRNIAERATLGKLALTMGDPQSPSVSFNMFDQVAIQAPELYMYQPLVIRPKLVNPLTQGLGLDIFVGMPNPGPFHLNLGVVGAKIMNGGGEFGRASTPDAVVLKNVNEGGNDPNLNQFRLAVRLELPKNPLLIWGALLDILMGKFTDFSIEFFAETIGGQRVPWLTACLDGVPLYLKGNFLRIVVGLLTHMKIQLGPFTIPPPPIFNQAAQNLLGSLPQQVLITDFDAPLGFLPANSTAANQTMPANITSSVSTSLSAPTVSTTVLRQPSSSAPSRAASATAPARSVSASALFVASATATRPRSEPSLVVT